jgi:hypothetical protein
MGFTVIITGFKAPVSILDRFIASNSVEETNGTAPQLFYLRYDHYAAVFEYW